MGVKDLRMRLLVLSVTGAGIVALSPKLNQRALESAVVKGDAAVQFLSIRIPYPATTTDQLYSW
jgi:hypothetical protein